jgi:hypothetical protein
MMHARPWNFGVGKMSTGTTGTPRAHKSRSNTSSDIEGFGRSIDDLHMNGSRGGGRTSMLEFLRERATAPATAKAV